MKVNQIQSQNFKGFNTSKAGNKLMERLCTESRSRNYRYLEISQLENPFDINLTFGKYRNIIGQIVNKDGNVLYTAKENKLRSFLNLSPINFLDKLCTKADELLKQSIK